MKKMFRKQVEKIEAGDTITIAAQGYKVHGTVLSATRWGDDMGWFIELTDANVPGGYSYWKQVYDGGIIVEHNGREVEEMKDLPEVIQELKILLQMAGPLPWRVRPPMTINGIPGVVDANDESILRGRQNTSWHADVLAVAAVNALPEILKRLEELEGGKK